VLVELNVTEQRYRAVLLVKAGSPVTEVAEVFGVSRQAVHRWLAWYRDEGLAGLADRSHRPHGHPDQIAPEVEAAICELRRLHPRWGQRRIEFELGRNGCPGPIPSVSTIYRVLVRQHLIDPVPRRRRRQDYKRWQREAPMELWQLDIVDGIICVDGTEGKVVTGVDDHSRFCVIAKVVAKATGRAVCAGVRGGAGPLRHPRRGAHRQRQTVHRPVRQTSTGGGDVRADLPGERDRGPQHQTPQPDHHRQDRAIPPDPAGRTGRRPPTDYNTNRPHQSLGMAFPADRFVARGVDTLGQRLPPSLAGAAATPAQRPAAPVPPPPPPVTVSTVRPATSAADLDLAIECDRIVPASGNLAVGGQQFWFGPNLGGVTITLWANTTVVHLFRDGHRLKTVPSRLTPATLRQLLADGGRPAGPSRLPAGDGQGTAVEVDRLVNATGVVSMAGHQCPVGYHYAGRRITIRLDGAAMHLLDLDRTLLRSLPNPLPPGVRPRDGRPAGPPPVIPDTPPPVQRRVSCRGAIQVARQKIQVGIGHAGATVDVHTTDTTWRIHLDDQLLVEVPRTADRPVARFKVRKPEPPRSRQTDLSDVASRLRT
jgi:transposase-like protein